VDERYISSPVFVPFLSLLPSLLAGLEGGRRYVLRTWVFYYGRACIMVMPRVSSVCVVPRCRGFVSDEQ